MLRKSNYVAYNNSSWPFYPCVLYPWRLSSWSHDCREVLFWIQNQTLLLQLPPWTETCPWMRIPVLPNLTPYGKIKQNKTKPLPGFSNDLLLIMHTHQFIYHNTGSFSSCCDRIPNRREESPCGEQSPTWCQKHGHKSSKATWSHLSGWGSKEKGMRILNEISPSFLFNPLSKIMG